MADMINLNSAQIDELTTLPGVGTAMAKRIVASRPYSELEDLLQVNGIGPALLERLTPLITVVDDEEQELQDDVIYLDEVTQTGPGADFVSSEVDVEDSITKPGGLELEVEDISEGVIPREKAIISVDQPEEKQKSESKKPKPITMNQLLLITSVCSLLAFILAVFLSIGIIGSINGGLSFASAEQVQNLDRQVELLDIEISTLDQDLDSLRTRLDNLEGLSGRIGELETGIENLSQGFGDLSEIYGDLDTKVEEISNIAEGFQIFLKGLGELLDNLEIQNKGGP